MIVRLDIPVHPNRVWSLTMAPGADSGGIVLIKAHLNGVFVSERIVDIADLVNLPVCKRLTDPSGR